MLQITEARTVRLLVVAAMLISVVILPDGPVSASHEPAAIIRVTTDMDGGHAGGSSFSPSISGNGTRIAYSSEASDLVPGDTNGFNDIFLYDTTAGTTTLISTATDGGPANGWSGSPSISADGTRIAFGSGASNLVEGDTNEEGDVFLYDTTTGATTSLSGDISWDPGDLQDIYPFFLLDSRSINADGTKIVFYLYGEGAGDCETVTRGYLYDTAAGTAVEAWHGVNPSISGDGSRIAYEAGCNAPFDHPPPHVYLRDFVTGTTTLISKNSDGTPSTNGGFAPSLSADGTKVAYTSYSADPQTVEYNGNNIFVYDTVTDTTTLVNKDPVSGLATGRSSSPSINADGTVIAFRSWASNLVEGDTSDLGDVFRYEMLTGTTTLISTDAEGGPANGNSREPSINADGTIIAFASKASDLVIGTAGGYQNVFLASAPLRDAAPQVTGFTISLPEDTSVGTTVGTVTASDVDGDPLSYAITAGNAAGLFTIGSTSGTITTSGVLDDETTKQHLVTVTVTDGTHNAYMTVIVNVIGSFDDDNDSIFEADIEWLSAAGITKGCDTNLFCPNDFVTRGQMAAFLTRALNLPPTSTGFFTDDNTSIFQDDINRLAASGITKGCDTNLFCPNDFVTRGQMAAFLTRALNLPPTSTGFFTDDNTSIFQDDINRLAASGITKGCDTNSFCPNDFVTRGQMAAFLHRALS